MHCVQIRNRLLALAVLWATLDLLAAPAAYAAASGEDVYAKRCSGCHDQTNPRIPARDSLQKIPASRILKVLDFGAMVQIAYTMTREEREGDCGASGGLPGSAQDVLFHGTWADLGAVDVAFGVDGDTFGRAGGGGFFVGVGDEGGHFHVLHAA